MSTLSFLDRFSLSNKVVVITGGAGQLGTAFAHALLDGGATVVLADLKKVSPQKLDELFPSMRKNISSYALNILSPQSVNKLIDQVEKKVGPIDVWINNAGIGVFTPYKLRTLPEFDQVMNVNVKGNFICTKSISERMEKRKRGNIINIGSIYGMVSPDPRIYADSKRNSSEVYGASKSAVIQMTRYFAVHLAPANIRVNCITPGGVFNHQAKKFVKNYEDKTPLKRMAQPDDIAGGIVYLASDASSYVTGHNLVIDGGWTAW